MTVFFETGFGTEGIEDYWSALLHVKDGPQAGFYASSGTDTDAYWKECQLQHEDAGQTLTLAVNPTQFNVALASGGCTGSMSKLAPATPITHVFVVVLENHSFDNMFAMSGIPGIKSATVESSNKYNNIMYAVQPSAPLSMPTDPGHEFPDVVEQLAGVGASYTPGGAYPNIDNSGFAANYATSTSEGPTPPPQDIGDIMACFATSSQLPVLYQLATEFALCDQWHASLPGPTWPNRFFVHGASSSGLDTSPTKEQITGWESPVAVGVIGGLEGAAAAAAAGVPEGGFQYPNGSIYDSLKKAGTPYRFYNDSTGFPQELSLYSNDPQNGSKLGAIPQAAALKGVSVLDFNSLARFAADLQTSYPYPYTFIEPHYGDIANNSYLGGSSQHPLDDVYGGEHLLASVYAAIRSSPYWNTSLLIITYDEHGGFYDSVAPGQAVAPGDNPAYGYSKYGFNFEQYGVRVPAVIVSPLIARGTVDHTLYDHTSILKTVEQLFGLTALTKRDAAANSVLDLLSLATARTDCPASLNTSAPVLKGVSNLVASTLQQQNDTAPLPLNGNLLGALSNLRKTDVELSGGTPAELAAINSRVAAIQTRGHARAYADTVMNKVAAVRQQRKTTAQAKSVTATPGKKTA
jgi:phospholipase C